MKKFVTLLLIAHCMALHVAAQTAVWQLPPSNYEAISRLNTNLYRVEHNGKVGLIRADGTVVAAVENDDIGLFYEHLALVTRNDGTGERVSGCLTDDGKYYNFSERYYTLAGQKFFSDGLLSVSDANGKVGYIDLHGNKALGFDGKYDRIKPFVEGHAAVFKNKKYHLIDKAGTLTHFQFKGVGEVYGGTNVHQGLAYVWDGDGKFYSFDVNQGDYCQKVKLASDKPTYDYLYCFSIVSGRSKTVPFRQLNTSGTPGLSATQFDGAWGYRSPDNRVVLPGQFDEAGQFEDGYAVVTLQGRKGILRYIDGNGFSAAAPAGTVDFYDDDAVTLRFDLSVPQAWQGKVLQVEVRDAAGTQLTCSNGSGFYTFAVHPNATANLDYQLTIRGEGLKLYTAGLSYSVQQHHHCPVCGNDLEVCHGKHADETRKTEEPKCPTCGLKISECKYQGVH